MDSQDENEFAAEVEKHDRRGMAKEILLESLRLCPLWPEQRRVRFAIDLATRFYDELEKDTQQGGEG